MKVYISGPITGHEGYLDEFGKAERLLNLHGYEVINPARELLGMPDDTTWELYMAVCWNLFQDADRIYLLPGWMESKGARLERKWAEDNGIPIMEEICKQQSQKNM